MRKKFSLTENSILPNETLRHIANVFHKIGFKTFVGKFMPCPDHPYDDYAYAFTSLEKIKSPIHGNKDPTCHVHICVTV